MEEKRLEKDHRFIDDYSKEKLKENEFIEETKYFYNFSVYDKDSATEEVCIIVTNKMIEQVSLIPKLINHNGKVMLYKFNLKEGDWAWDFLERIYVL